METETSTNIETLKPQELYTQEVMVYKSGINSANLKKPIYFGRDINGKPYVTDGNHRAMRALRDDKTLLGIQVAEGNFDVTNNEYFHPVTNLKVVDK